MPHIAISPAGRPSADEWRPGLSWVNRPDRAPFARGCAQPKPGSSYSSSTPAKWRRRSAAHQATRAIRPFLPASEFVRIMRYTKRGLCAISTHRPTLQARRSVVATSRTSSYVLGICLLFKGRFPERPTQMGFCWHVAWCGPRFVFSSRTPPDVDPCSRRNFIYRAI